MPKMTKTLVLIKKLLSNHLKSTKTFFQYCIGLGSIFGPKMPLVLVFGQQIFGFLKKLSILDAGLVQPDQNSKCYPFVEGPSLVYWNFFRKFTSVEKFNSIDIDH